MINGRFQILLRKRQNVYSNPSTGVTYNVIVQCNPVTTWAEYVPGNVDNTWYDYTEFIEDSENLSLTWDKKNAGGETGQDGSNIDKGITSDLVFFDSAYQFIKNWLLTEECQILNCVEVKIVDLIAHGTYRIFEIKNDNIEDAPIDEPCRYKIKLREQDSTWHCIHKTFIWDNWQNWFKDDSVKQHPCFLTCIEPRPRLINSARMGLSIFYHSTPILSLFGNINDDARRILNANRFVDSPLVRTYIENVAGKCGLAMDTIFDEGQHWENLCIFYPQAGYMHENDGGADSPSLSYHFDNRWMITIAELLDKLKLVFAAEWYVTPGNTIVFKYTKDLITLAAIYDFSADGAEPIYGLVYTFNGDKKSAYGRYQYQVDGSDLASQEVSTLYNDIVDYDGPQYNPMLEGEKTKNFEFAPTGFVRDGRAKDYIKLLINDGKVVASVLLIILTIILFALTSGASLLVAAILGAIVIDWGININNHTNNLKDLFVDGATYTGAVRLTSEQVLAPRLLLWDGGKMDRAKTIRQTTMPTPNSFYNPNLTAYNIKNKIAEDNPDHAVYNYPLYFDGDFKENLFDSYHDEIDNPLKSKESHQEFKFYIDLCEEMLNLFGVFENQYAVIGKVVKIQERENYSVYGRIGNISVDYEGNKINIKGNVLRRAA